MNILIIHEVDWIKKVAYEIHHLSEIFSMNGHNVYAIDIPESDGSSVDQKNRKSVSDYHRIYDNAHVHLLHTPIIPLKGLNRISAYFTSYSFIKKALKDFNIDVVLLYSVVSNAKATIKACSEMRIPVVHRTFDIVHELIREKYLRRFVLQIEKSVYPKFDKVIANTPFMESWSHEIGAKHVNVISQGVDPNIMKPLPKDKELQQELGVSDDDKIMMYLGSIEWFSGLPFLIKSMPTILKQIPELKLLVIGGGSHLEPLKNLAQKLRIDDKVIFTGYRPYKEVPKYASLAVLCVNTFEITTVTKRLSPVKVFDLLACGKPILVTPLEGLLHDFPRDSNTVIYSELENFPNTVTDLIKNANLDEIGKRGRDYVMKNYTWEMVAKRFLDEFQSLLK